MGGYDTGYLGLVNTNNKTAAQEIEALKTNLASDSFRRSVAINRGEEDAEVWSEVFVKALEIRSGDLVFPEPGLRPYISAVDATECSLLGKAVVIHDEQLEIHYFPADQVLRVLRLQAEEEKNEPEGERPPWELG